MYDVNWALTFNGFSKIENLDLHNYMLFYNDHIANRDFIFTTAHPALPEFVVESRSSQFPHLIGLQHWNNLETKQSTRQYNELLSGEWTLDFLEKADRGAFRKYRDRIDFVPYLYRLLFKADCIVKIVSNAEGPFKKRRIDIVFQKPSGKRIGLLELREIKPNRYTIVTITIHREGAAELKVKATKLNITGIAVTPINQTEILVQGI